MEIKNHFGVYGICYEKGKLLCIEKTNIVLIYLVVVRKQVKG